MTLSKFASVTVFSFALASLSNAQVFFPQTDASQRTYDDIVHSIGEIAKANPANVELFDIGVSDSGKTIQGLKIGHGEVADLVVSTHHGNEYGATELAMAFAQDIAITPIANKTVYVIPVLNISGYNKKSRYESASGESVDPNRDYPGPCGTEGPFHLKSTKALQDFVAAKNIVASATLHTYWPTVAYPWGVSTGNFTNIYQDIFKSLAASATSLSHYETGTSGAVVYPADGTFEDYSFWKYGIWSLLFEVGNSHVPDQSDIDEINRTNVPGLRKMMEDAKTTRAENHDFTNGCSKVKSFDPHIE